MSIAQNFKQSYHSQNAVSSQLTYSTRVKIYSKNIVWSWEVNVQDHLWKYLDITILRAIEASFKQVFLVGKINKCNGSWF